MSTDERSDESPRKAIRVTVPERYYLLPGAAIIAGTVVGLMRGSRAASLRFLAENAHRAPTTVQGWYFYNKTKNYRVIMGGLKQAGWESMRLGAVGAGWVVFEEGSKYLGLDDGAELVAGVGTAGVFSAMYGLPWRAARRAVVLGGLVGGTLDGLRWGKARLAAEAASRRDGDGASVA